jgi:hypothetical protein
VTKPSKVPTLAWFDEALSSADLISMTWPSPGDEFRYGFLGADQASTAGDETAVTIISTDKSWTSFKVDKELLTHDVSSTVRIQQELMREYERKVERELYRQMFTLQTQGQAGRKAQYVPTEAELAVARKLDDVWGPPEYVSAADIETYKLMLTKQRLAGDISAAAMRQRLKAIDDHQVRYAKAQRDHLKAQIDTVTRKIADRSGGDWAPNNRNIRINRRDPRKGRW